MPAEVVGTLTLNQVRDMLPPSDINVKGDLANIIVKNNFEGVTDEHAARLALLTLMFYLKLIGAKTHATAEA